MIITYTRQPRAFLLIQASFDTAPFAKKLAARHRSTWLLCKERYSVLGLQTEIYKTIINVPAVISIHPIRDFAVNSSCKKINAKINVITTLNLSIGTTFEASPLAMPCNSKATKHPLQTRII